MAESKILQQRRQLALARQESQILLDRINLALQAPKGVRLSAPSASDTYILGTARARALVDEYMGLNASKIFNVYQGHSVQDAVSDFAMRLTARLGGGSDVRKLVDAASEIFAVLLVRPLRDVARTEARKSSYHQQIRAGLQLFEEVLAKDASLQSAISTLNKTADFTFSAGSGVSGTTYDFDPAFKAELQSLYGAAPADPLSNIYSGKTGDYALYSSAYLRYVDSLVSQESRQRENMITFMADDDVLTNVNMLLGSKRPSSKVLLPDVLKADADAAAATASGAAAIKAARESAVRNAFASSPDKSIKATFDYYKALYSKVEDTNRILIDKGDFKLALKSAGESIDALIKEIRKSPTRGDSGFISLLKKVKSNILKAKTPIQLVDAAAEYLDLIGVVTIGTAATVTAKKAGSQLNRAINARYRSADVFSSLLETLDGSKLADAKGTQAEVRYNELGNVMPTRSTDFWTMSLKEAAADVTMRLNYAYGSVAGLGTISPITLPADKPQVTKDFKDAAVARLTTLINSVGTDFVPNMPTDTAGLLGRAILDALGADSTGVDVDAYDAGVIAGVVSALDADAPAFLYMSTGTLPSANVSYARDRQLAELDALALSSTERSIAVSLIDATLTDLRDTVKSAIVEAQAKGIAIRSNPAIAYGRAAGMSAFKGIGTHAATALTHSVSTPKMNTTGFQLAEYGASTAAIGYGAYQIYRNGDYQSGAEWIGGALLNIGLRAAARNTKLRFGEGVVAKAVQLLGNAPATLVKDPSLYGSMLTMGPVKLTDDMQPFLVDLAYANSADNFVCICLKLMADSKMAINFAPALGAISEQSVIAASSTVTNAANLNALIGDCVKFHQLLNSGSEVQASPQGIKASAVDGLTYSDTLSDRATVGLVASTTAAAFNIEGFSLSNNTVAGFIATPSYDGPPVYSATERYTPLVPQPNYSRNESDYDMLVQAMQRAHKLDSHELDVEQLSGTSSPVIKAEPSAARKMERMGLGQSLGHSMTEPHLELVAVEWANGPASAAPERNYAVPQGALAPTPITQAPNIQVSPTGLFTKGAFTPLYGR